MYLCRSRRDDLKRFGDAGHTHDNSSAKETFHPTFISLGSRQTLRYVFVEWGIERSCIPHEITGTREMKTMGRTREPFFRRSQSSLKTIL